MWLVCGYFKILVGYFGYFGYFQKQIWLFSHILIWQPCSGGTCSKQLAVSSNIFCFIVFQCAFLSNTQGF
jgi:hypothetical protein